MSEIFLHAVNISVKAGWMVLFVLVVRGIFPKLPSGVRMLLWALVAVRLVCPELPESVLSLLPASQTVSADIMTDTVPGINSGIPAVDLAAQRFLYQHFAPDPTGSANPMQILVAMLSQIWLLGMAAMGVYAVVSFLKLRHRVREAIKTQEGIFLCEKIPSAFVLGFWKPNIYLPFCLEADVLPHVIAHEKAHIQNRDPVWKVLGFALLAVYWFHPLMWVAYLLFCGDLELACDARVIRNMDRQHRGDYSQALLACGAGRKHVRCPLAFGEVCVRKRVEAVLRYKRGGVGTVVMAVVLCAALVICFLTEPVGGGGIGIRALRVTSHETAAAALELDYFGMESSGFTCRAVPADEGEYTGDGMVAYDGALGQYRLLILFGDTEPTAGFCKRFPVGQVVELENVPQTFGGTLRCKVVYPQDHGFGIYIGSDKPFAFKEPALYNYKYLGGTLVFRLYNVAE